MTKYGKIEADTIPDDTDVNVGATTSATTTTTQQTTMASNAQLLSYLIHSSPQLSNSNYCEWYEHIEDIATASSVSHLLTSPPTIADVQNDKILHIQIKRSLARGSDKELARTHINSSNLLRAIKQKYQRTNQQLLPPSSNSSIHSSSPSTRTPRHRSRSLTSCSLCTATPASRRPNRSRSL